MRVVVWKFADLHCVRTAMQLEGRHSLGKDSHMEELRQQHDAIWYLGEHAPSLTETRVFKPQEKDAPRRKEQRVH